MLRKIYNPYLFELAKKWLLSFKVTNIPGVELDDVYGEVYLIWMELGKPEVFSEKQLCAYYYRVIRNLGYWQGCDRFIEVETVEATQYEMEVNFFEKYANKIEQIEDELKRAQNIKTAHLVDLFGLSEQSGRRLRSHYEKLVIDRCKHKLGIV